MEISSAMQCAIVPEIKTSATMPHPTFGDPVTAVRLQLCCRGTATENIVEVEAFIGTATDVVSANSAVRP